MGNPMRIPVGISVGIPVGMSMGVPTGVPIGIPTGIPTGIPAEISAETPAEIPAWIFAEQPGQPETVPGKRAREGAGKNAREHRAAPQKGARRRRSHNTSEGGIRERHREDRRAGPNAPPNTPHPPQTLKTLRKHFTPTPPPKWLELGAGPWPLVPILYSKF